MAFSRLFFRSLLAASSSLWILQTSHGLDVPLPRTAPTNGTVAYGNYLGISFEFSFLGYYFGTNLDNTPQPFLNYISNYQAYLPDLPIRLRIGGDSMDSSTFNESQAEFSISTIPSSNSSDVAVEYGPLVFKVMNAVAGRLGKVQYLFGLNLEDATDPTIPEVAATAQSVLGDSLDAWLLGNEPDLYSYGTTGPNYTVRDYIDDYGTVFEQLNQSTNASVALSKISGPTICCFWDLATVLQRGWLSEFNKELKYISLQHYPKDGCGSPGSAPPSLDYYVNHMNVILLAQWNIHGVNIANTAGKPVIMTEFSSASCGGYPNVSDTFGAALWSVDYAMQMSAVGYSGAHLHVRERNASYNPFLYPGDGADTWSTGPVYYSFFPVLQGLQSYNGSRVVDLGLSNKSTAGYAVYDKGTSELYRLILINYQDGNGPVNFVIPATSSPRAGGGKNTTVKFLVAPSIHEGSNISWSGMTWNDVVDGNPVASGWGEDVTQADMSGSWTLEIPSPGLAVVMFEKPLPSGEPHGGEPSTPLPNPSGNLGGNSTSSNGARKGNGDRLFVFSVGVPILVTLATITLAL